MSLLYLSDEAILRYYEDVRKEVEADKGNNLRFIAGPAMRTYAETLREEIVRRGLHCEPIDWPVD